MCALAGRSRRCTPARLRLRASANAASNGVHACIQHISAGPKASPIDLFTQLASQHCRTCEVQLSASTAGGYGWVLKPPFADTAYSTHVVQAAANAPGNPSDLPGQVPEAGMAAKEAAFLQAELPGTKERVLVSVPLHLCLSHCMPGACTEAYTSAALAPAFANEALPWELKLGIALLWAVHRDPGNSAAGAFWSRYAQLLPALQDLSTVLVMSRDELLELQVRAHANLISVHYEMSA